MGIVFKQSFNNTIVTFFGFGVGAVNTLFLYTHFLSDAYYGLVGVILSTAALLMPIMAFGVANTLIKYYSSYKSEQEKNRFLSFMLILPLLGILPLWFFAIFANEQISTFLSHKNTIVKGYEWYIFIVGVAMAYFEVFNAWVKVQLKSVFGNFLKEVFVRVGVSILLCLLYVEVINVTAFLYYLVGLYLLRLLVMIWYAFVIKSPNFVFKLPSNFKNVLSYSFLIILGGSTAIVLTEIDKFMINQYIAIENVAYYSVAVFIATVIAVPSRSMHQITYPLTASLYNKRDFVGLKSLYKKTSINLFSMACLLFLLITLNLSDLLSLLPNSYYGGFIVVFLIGLARVFDALLGNNNAILYSSDYYKTVLYMGVFLAIATICLNLWLLPIYGIIGAAMATLIAISLYNIVKILFVWRVFKMHPFKKETLIILLSSTLIGIGLYYVPIPFNGVLNIFIRSVITLLVFTFCLYKFHISEDISMLIKKYVLRFL